MGRRLSDLLFGHRRLQVGLLLSGPLGWLVVAYLGSLLVLFVAAFWQLDPFSGVIVKEPTTDNFRTILETDVYRTIALPGIVTGMALNTTFTQVLGVNLGLFTVIVGHATFCVVVVFNNVVARLRRTPGSFVEAAEDLGAHSFQAFRTITLPQMRSALVAGALLAFALSFDEVIVTTFTAGSSETLPIWILNNLSRPNQLPIVNVVAVLAIVLSLIPVWLAQRLSADPLSSTAPAAR